MHRIHGIPVRLAVKTQTGTDPFGKPVYGTDWETVENVLVGQPSADDINTSVQLYGKKCAYMVAIPKGDTHSWEDTLVKFPAPFAGVYHTLGFVVAGIEDLVPLSWNGKIAVERYG